METIHEVIEEDLPEWAKKAFMNGTLFAELGQMIDAAYKQGVSDTQYRTVVLEKSLESVREVLECGQNTERQTHHLLVAIIEASGIKKGD